MDATPHRIIEKETKEPGPPVGPPAAGAEAADLWQQALDMLRHTMSPEAFAGLLGGSRVVEATDDTWTIGVCPHAAHWLSGRPYLLIKRTVDGLAGREVSLKYVAEEPPAVDRESAVPAAKECHLAPPRAPVSPPAPARPGRQAAPKPSAPARQAPAASSLTVQKPAASSLAQLLAFDPNSAKGGGFWKMGHYANWFWAAYLGTVAWRVYELVVSGDKRTQKTLWTPSRRYSVSELARAIASGRQRRPNRSQIRGRYRKVNGQRVWSPGAFDLLTREEVARIEWHAGDVHWRPWKPGGSSRPGRSGIRVVYRISVVTSLPLLTPRQVACLPAQNQVEHERYLANRSQDLVAWEQIALLTLAGLDPEAHAPVGGAVRRFLLSPRLARSTTGGAASEAGRRRRALQTGAGAQVTGARATVRGGKKKKKKGNKEKDMHLLRRRFLSERDRVSWPWYSSLLRGPDYREADNRRCAGKKPGLSFVKG